MKCYLSRLPTGGVLKCSTAIIHEAVMSVGAVVLVSRCIWRVTLEIFFG